MSVPSSESIGHDNLTFTYPSSVSFGSFNRDDDCNYFLPLVIIEFSEDANQAAREWLTAKLEAVRQNRGAELQVRTHFFEQTKSTILYVSASTERLLIGAEELKIMKPDIEGVMRELSLVDIDAFKDSGDLDAFLTMAEKQKVIMKGIESLRASDDEEHIPGYPKYRLYSGKSIFKKYLSRCLVLNIYPLHDVEELKEVGTEWYSLKNMFKKQPIDRIQQYFGTKIALYFSFLGFYTVSLIPPALIGVIYFIFSGASMYREAVFSVFNLIWTTLFLESWKRYCSTLSFKWGTMDSASRYAYTYEEPQPDFRGTMGTNKVTGEPEPQYPKYKRLLKLYLVTIPVMTFWLTMAFFTMLAYFWAEDWMKAHGPKNMGLITTFNNLLPTIGYAIIIGILNGLYRKVAVKLNKFENHRLQSSYDNHLIVKLILFDFINCFICLFYVAFYMQNRTLLKTFLGTLLVTQQVVGQIQESIIPFLFVKRRQKQLNTSLKESETALLSADSGIDIDTQSVKQAALESKMEKYGGSNDEYLEMYIQFGYVYLFSSAFPLAAMWAFLNNLIEIRSDAFKLCRVYQRPFTDFANSIGAWQTAFEVIGLISVITNCALIGMDPNVQKLLPSSISAVNMVLIFVAAEHIVLAIKASVAFLIPDLPKWVIMEMAKQEYVAKLALRRQKHDEHVKNKTLSRLAAFTQKKNMVKAAVIRRQTKTTDHDGSFSNI